MQLAALALLMCAAPGSAENLNFGTGTLAGWEGSGFYVTTPARSGPSLSLGVCSSDCGKQGKSGILHRTVVVPPGAGVLRFSAYTQYAKDCPPTDDLDVVLYAAGRQLIPKQVKVKDEWKPTSTLLPRLDGKPREYVWNVANFVGQTLRVALVDEDKRPGCYVVCSGFRFVAHDVFEGNEFNKFMVKITEQHRLPPVSRFESKHFVAISNAEDSFTEHRLNNCELIYDLFYDHFRNKGFRIHQPGVKLMVAIFDSQAGFEAYLGQKMSAAVTGVYHPPSNRLLVYDYGQNEAFVAYKRHTRQESRKIGSDLDRLRFVQTENRRTQEFRTEANIGTIMHEVSHQLSFNCGMLNRDGDVALWLAEGLACYCEATDNSTWQGIGEPNPERIHMLTVQIRGGGKLIPLTVLIESDEWLRGKNALQLGLLGYAQSWALFRMLMQERPREMRNYLDRIYSRRTGDYRMDDFLQAFGTDLPRLELRYGEYCKELVEHYGKARR